MVISSSSPVQFSKWLSFNPNSFTLLFIISTKAESLPAIYSPRSVQASFAEAIITAFSKSFTLICSPTSSQICEPPFDTAFSLAATISSSPILPLSIDSSIISILTILVTDAGDICSYAFSSLIISPVFIHISILDLTLISLSSAIIFTGIEIKISRDITKIIILFIISPLNNITKTLY